MRATLASSATFLLPTPTKASSSGLPDTQGFFFFFFQSSDHVAPLLTTLPMPKLQAWTQRRFQNSPLPICLPQVGPHTPWALVLLLPAYFDFKYVALFPFYAGHGILMVVLYRCKSCTIKKAEPRRIDAFKLWSWRRL